MTWRGGLALALLAFAFPRDLQAQTPGAADGIGPFRFGMSFAEARAAAPKVKWSETLSRQTKAPTELDGEKAFRLGDRAFDVSLKPRAYGAYDISVVFAEDGVRTSEARCQEAVAALGEELQNRFGELEAVTPLRPEETGSLPLGFDLLGGGEARTGPPEPGAEIFRNEDTSATFWVAGRRKDGVNVVLGGRHLGARSPMWPSTCVVAATLQLRPEDRPQFEWLDFAKLAKPPVVSLAARRRSFAGGSPLPEASSDVGVICIVNRRFGGLSKCQADQGVAAVSARPAERQAAEIRLEPAALEPDKDIPLKVRLTLRIDPADAAVIGPPDGVVPLESRDVPWAKAPTNAELAKHFPERAVRMDISGQLVVLCRVEGGGVLTCPTMTAKTAPGQESVFDGWEDVVAGLYVAAPTLADGRPTAGAWVRFVFNLQFGG